MLEFDDIQHILLTRAPALTGRYEFLSFRDAAGGRAWLAAILEKVQSAAAMRASVEKEQALGHRGLHLERPARTRRGRGFAGHVSRRVQARHGRPARRCSATPGENHPDNWVGGLASPDLHAIVILFARDAAERARCQAEHDKLVARCEGVEVLSALDLEATPPFDHAHDHFGYRDRLSQPVIEGARRGTDARLGRAAQAGRVHPRLPGRRRACRRSAAAGDSVPQRQLHGLSPA